MKKATLLWTLLLATNAKTFAMQRAVSPTFEVVCIHQLKNAVAMQEEYYSVEIKKIKKTTPQKNSSILLYFPEKKKKIAALPENDLLDRALIKFMALRKGKTTLLYDKKKNFIEEQMEK